MGFSVTTNVASLSAQNSIHKTSRRLNQSLQRLSTGLRINSGRDDPVGLQRSEFLRSQIRGVDFARSNVSNANAMFGVAEGFLGQLSEISQNMRDLAVQAADATIDSSTRDALSSQLSGLMGQYNDLTNSAKFNGEFLLDGSFAGRTIQTGPNEGENLSLTINDARSGSIGRVAIFTSVTLTSSAAAGAADLAGTPTTSGAAANENNMTITGNGVTVAIAAAEFVDDGVSSNGANESAIAYVNAINKYSSQTGVTARVMANVKSFNYTTGADLLAAQDLLINGITVKSDGLVYDNDDDGEIAALVSLINEKSSETGVTASMDAANDWINFTAADGRNIFIEHTGAAAEVFGIFGGATSEVIMRSRFTLTSSDVFTMTNMSDEVVRVAGPTTATVSAGTALSTISFDTANEAGTAISILDRAIEQIQERRTEIGAVANQLELAETELASRTENLSAAESVIRDADIAAETAKFTLLTVLQQMGATILAQANSTPQIALTLLQNL